jgi:cobalt-zinc-cadmium efflux system outer membrane protein
MNLKAGVAILTASCALISFAQGQPTDRKALTLRGTVEGVNLTTRQISIANEPIPGGMGSMTMNYSVDKEAVLGQVKPGDRITAKFYEGDTKLYEVRILPAAQVATKPAPPGMRLEDLEGMALAGNPTLAQAQANVQIAAGQARQAGLYPNPTAGYYGDEIRGGYYGGGKQGGFVSQTIVTGGKLRAARHVAELLKEEAKTTGDAQRLRILNNVRAVFYRVLAAQRLLEVRENLAKLAADATETTHQLANVGQADRPDVLQAEVEQQQMSVSLRISQQNLRALWRMLAAVVGKPDLPQTRLEGDLEAIPDLNYEEWLATALRESPEVKLALQAVDRAEASVTQAKKVPIPDLQLYGNLSQNYEPLETTRKPVGLNGGVQIGVQLPIFNRNQGNIAAAKAETESARQEVVRVKLELSREVANLFRDYDSARATAQQYKTEMLPRAEQAYNLYRTNYRNMAAAYPQALISQRTLFQLEVDYVQALESVWQSALGIRGFGEMDGLSMPVGPSGGRVGGSGSQAPGQ